MMNKMNDYQCMNQASLQCQKCHGSTWFSTHLFLIMSLYMGRGRSYRTGKLLTVTVSLFSILHTFVHSISQGQITVSLLKMNSFQSLPVGYQHKYCLSVSYKCHLPVFLSFQEFTFKRITPQTQVRWMWAVEQYRTSLQELFGALSSSLTSRSPLSSTSLSREVPWWGSMAGKACLPHTLRYQRHFLLLFLK